MTNENENTNSIQTELENTTPKELEPISTQPITQRPYSSTNIPLTFEAEDDVNAIMETYNTLTDEEQTQTKRELCEYYGDKLDKDNTIHNVHTPEFIYSTGDKQQDEEKIQNIISKSSGSLAKNPNHTISIEEFKRRFKLEREAHKEFYGSNPYINAMHDAFIQASILNRVKYKEQYNTPKAIEISNQLGYKPAYEDTSLYPQYATNTLSPTMTDGIVVSEDEIKINTAYKDIYQKRNGGVNLQEIYFATFKNGKLIQDAPSNSEGKYNYDDKDRGGETNMGITQKTLEEYKNTYQSSYKSNIPLPKSVKNLTQKQALIIYNEMYFRPYNINFIPNIKLARITFDSCILAGPKMNKFYTKEILKITGKNLNDVIKTKNEDLKSRIVKNIETTIPSDIAQLTNQLSETQITKLADNLLDARMEHHFTDITQNNEQIKYLQGWYNRARNLYSSPNSFDKKYFNKKEDFLTKYKHYRSKNKK